MTAAKEDATVWTVARLLSWTQGFLREHQVESPRLCAEILLAHALRCERLRLYTAHEDVPDEAARTTFRELVRAAAAGRPIAYLTGTKEFFSLTFEVSPDVLIPRPETEILVERTISLVRRGGVDEPTILDLGTGSGCVAIGLAKHLPTARVLASDISPAALEVAQRNAARHGLTDRIEFRGGDLFAPWQTHDTEPPLLDIIVCNPPYIAADSSEVEPSVRNFEPHTALFAGTDGLDVIRRLVTEAPHWLRGDGHLLMEMGYDQAAAVRALLDQSLWHKVTAYRDAAGHERVLHAQRAPREHTQVA